MKTTEIMTSKVVFFTLALLSLCSTLSPLHAQTQYSITGKVVDQQDSLVAGNALLLVPADSSLISGTFFLEGDFLLERITADPVLLKITSFGYQDTLVTINAPTTGNRIDIGQLVLAPTTTMLEGVTVTASTPLYEQGTDGTTRVNVQSTILANSTSASEILSKSPGVIVDESGVSVVGRGEAIIYIDGRLADMNQLSALAVARIASVEIINNPSAKYDAAGKSVVNVITIKNESEGLLATIVQNFTLAEHPLSNTNVSLNWQKKKWSLLADYGMGFGRDWSTNNLTRIVNGEDGVSQSVNDFEDNSLLDFVANYKLGARYQISATSDLSVEYLGATNNFDQDAVATTRFTDPALNRVTTNTENTGAFDNQQHAFNINFNTQIDTLGSSLFIGGQYSSFSSDNESIVDETITSSDNITVAERLNLSGNDISFFVGQADFTKKYAGGGTLDMGLKLTSADNSGKVDFFSRLAGEQDYEFFPSLSNDFTYNETIPAAYLQYSGAIKGKIQYVLGLRSELTDAEGLSRSTNSTVIDTTYTNLFPNASVNFNIKQLRVGVAYSTSINRPTYQALDPFLFYVDSLTTQQGNPSLVPEYAHSVEANLGYKQYSFKMGYTRTSDAFRYALLPGDNGPNSSTLQQINVQAEDSWYASANIPISWKKLRSYNIIGITLDQVRDNRPDFSATEFRARPYFYTYNSLMLGKMGKLELNGQFLGTRFDGIYFRRPTFTATAGWSRNFFNDKLSAALTVNDFFRSFDVDGFYEVANTRVSYLRRFNTYFYRLTLTFNLGELKNVNYKAEDVGKNANKRIRK